MTGTLLEQRGYHVIVALTGEQAVERAIAGRPDVIVLDLHDVAGATARSVRHSVDLFARPAPGRLRGEAG